MMSWNLLLAVGRRPQLWAEGLRTLFALAPRGWWRKAPFLPLPEQQYASWRVATSQGSANGDPSVSDVISYLEWRRRQHGFLRRV